MIVEEVAVSQVKSARPRAQLVAGRTDWFRITNLGNGLAEVYIYDEVGFWGVTAADFANELRGVRAETITCHINSPGGEVFDGIAIYNALKQHPAKVTIYVDSLAASVASVIAMAGDRVVMGEGAQMMIHNAHGLCLGNETDMRQMADLLERQTDNLAGFYARRAGGDKQKWRDLMAAETWFSADEAVAAGLADEATAFTPGDSRGVVKAEWDLSIFRYPGRTAAPAPTASITNRATTTPPPAVVAPAPTEPPAPVESTGPEWTAELADAFTAALRDEPDDEVIAALRQAGVLPPPPPTEPDVLIDPVEFFNAVREGTR